MRGVSTVEHDESLQEGSFKSEVSFRQLHSNHEELKFFTTFFFLQQYNYPIRDGLIANNIAWGVGWRSGESARLPPMCPGFDSRTRRHMWTKFVVGSPLCSERFFPG